MGKLSLILADSDENYIYRLEKYLVINYPRQFDIFSFTNYEKLLNFLNQTDKKDILLINSTIYDSELDNKNIGSIIFLAGDSSDNIPDGYKSVFKYQHIDKLVSDILINYSVNCNEGCNIRAGNTGTGSDSRIVCVSSPTGGAGTTSIAAGLSILGAARGMKTFYLNMESVPSTNGFFKSVNVRSNFSNVIFCLKDREKSLAMRLEGLKTCDMINGVSFFLPPDNILELEELTTQEISRLLNELKAAGSYDIIFLDMPCGLEMRMVSALNLADIILLVATPGNIAKEKMRRLMEGYDILKRKYGIFLHERLHIVSNKSVKIHYEQDQSHCYTRRVEANGISTIAEIGDYSGYMEGKADSFGLLKNDAFLSDLNTLLDSVMSILSGRLASPAAAMGGEGFG